MSEKSYRPWAPDQSFLLPPSPRDWLPEGHLAYFLLDVIGELDLSAIESPIQSKDPRGTRPYCPAMMVGLLIYGYCVGIRSSRRLERATYEDVAFRVIAGGNHPDHTRISEFRRQHQKAFEDVFLQVLQLCAKAGLVKLGQVAIDGTKVQANASKHKAMSYQRMLELEERLRAEIEQLLEAAERVDQQEDARFGAGQSEQDLPQELRRRQERLERLREAKFALEEEARQSRVSALRDQAERALQTAESTTCETVRKRSQTRARRLAGKARDLDDKDDDPPPSPGELPGHRVRARPDGTAHPKAQRNFTDPESRIMESGGTFLQGYNCQAAVDATAQVIVAADVSNQCPDNGHFVPMLEQVQTNCQAVPEVAMADSGYWAPQVPAHCQGLAAEVYIATERKKHGDTEPVVGDPLPTDPEEDPRETMRRKLQTEQGRKLYARRKAIVEPVFGQIKEGRGVRRFLLRGIKAARAEWQLICLTHNLLKLFRQSAAETA